MAFISFTRCSTRSQPWCLTAVQKSSPGLRCPASAKAPRVKPQQTKVVHSRSVSLPNEWGEKSLDIPGCANQYHSFPAAGLKCQINLFRLKTQVKPRKVIDRYTFWYATGEASTTCRRLWEKPIRTSQFSFPELRLGYCTPNLSFPIKNDQY